MSVTMLQGWTRYDSTTNLVWIAYSGFKGFFYKNKYVLLVANYRYMVFMHLSSYFVPLTKDIFPLDGCNHNSFHHFFSYPWSQLCSTCQALTKCRIMRDVIHHKVIFIFLLWTYFQHSYSSPMDWACSCRKKIRPYDSGFPVGCWDHSTFSVSVIRAA
jgi:hypothetical protein